MPRDLEPGALVVHRPSEQRMRVERRAHNPTAHAYWCTWRTLSGVTRRGLYAADELEPHADPDAPRPMRAGEQPCPEPFGYSKGALVTIDEVEP